MPTIRARLRAAAVALSAVAATAATPATADANICVTCETDPPPVPSGPTARYVVSHPDVGFSFGYNLIGLNAEDGSGYDELYIKVNGNKVFGPETVAAGPFPSPGNGYHATPFNYSFYTGLTQSPSFYISMFDDDAPDADDKLGGHQITGPPMAVGQIRPYELRYNADPDADYILWIQLKRVA